MYFVALFYFFNKIMVFCFHFSLSMLLISIGFYQEMWCHKDKASGECIEEHNRVRREVTSDHMNDLLIQTNFDKNYVAYFSGHEIIRYNNVVFNLNNFTIEFWIKLEGGQNENSPILTIFNHCSMFDVSAVTIGLIEHKDEGMKVYFSLKTQYHKLPTILYSHTAYKIQNWFHVAAVYDGTTMVLFINQAKVGVSYEQKGAFLANLFHKCTTLEVGGDSNKHTSFRGTIGDIKIWRLSKSHKDVSQHMYNENIGKELLNYLLLHETFSSDDKNKSIKYYSVTGLVPDILQNQFTKSLNNLELKIPECGRTVCDNPIIIKQYRKHADLWLKKKILRYRIINFANDDGSNPMLTLQEIKEKDKLINTVFNKYNISFQLSVYVLRNTYLRNKTVILRCYSHCGSERDECKSTSQIPECNSDCHPKKLGNKICNPECNSYRYSWDKNDCCNESYTNVSETCFDPSSIYRGFINENEMKKLVNLPSDTHLNIFPVKLRSDMLGKATFPWSPNVYTAYGGTSINSQSLKTTQLHDRNDIIHEIGHNLGLWHVHQGMTEINECDDKCVENTPSMIHGDLCDDTPPTPPNLLCKSELVVNNSKCGVKKYFNTPYKNFMGYAGGSCTDQFTPQQQARMHCYIDHFYQRWQPDNNKPSSIPLRPRILSSSQNSVQIAWLPPIGYGKKYTQHGCNDCVPRFCTLKQYAFKTFSPQDSQLDVNFHSSQVIGPPNSDTSCSPGPLMWIPKYRTGCKPNECYIDIFFERIVVPTGIKIWIVYEAKDSIHDIVLMHPDKTMTSLGPATTHCTTPYTKRIKTTKAVEKVRLYVTRSVGIDAVQLLSEENHPECKKCKQFSLYYRVYRLPYFNGGKKFETVSNVRFNDVTIKANIRYEYRVQVISGKSGSSLSLPLEFSTSRGFCGDGIVDRRAGEMCDDSNVRDGDGCDAYCKVETVFTCKEQPSLCYVHKRDGVCEDFEKETSVKDCGYFTPNGFKDQWASKIETNVLQSECPHQVVIGQPPYDLKCVSFMESINRKEAWRPCPSNTIREYSIEATYEHEEIAAAVIIYLASDGVMPYTKPVITVELKDIFGVYHKATNNDVSPSCSRNPLVIHVMHDMTKPVFKTSAVRVSFAQEVSNIAISAIRLRSAEKEYYQQCAHNQQFNETTQKCQNLENQLECQPLKLENATLNCTGNKNGAQCHVKCSVGYLPTHPFLSRCDSGEWRAKSKCQLVDCGKPNFEHIIANCSSTTYGSTCAFRCNKKSQFYGTSAFIICDQNGSWRKPTGHCFATCPVPKHIKNSDLHVTDTFINLCNNKNKKNWDMGTRCRYRCKPGYRPIRYVSRKVTGGNTINIFCNSNGVWKQDGYCEKITCPPLSHMMSFLYNCTNQNKYKSICTTTCLGTRNSAHHVVCTENGEWSTTFDICEKKGQCKQLAVLTSNTLDMTSCTSNIIGSVCRPQCKRRKTFIIPDIILKGKEEQKEVVLYCMPNREWMPSEKDLQCVEPCVSRELGDFFCDCHNNNKHCMYDGGDCCPESPSSQVEYFPLSLTRCECIDPDAIKKLKNLEKNKRGRF